MRLFAIALALAGCSQLTEFSPPPRTPTKPPQLTPIESEQGVPIDANFIGLVAASLLGDSLESDLAFLAQETSLTAVREAVENLVESNPGTVLEQRGNEWLANHHPRMRGVEI